MLSSSLITLILYHVPKETKSNVSSSSLSRTFLSGPLIIVITLLRGPIYYKMRLERSEQYWTLHLNFYCNIIQ